MASVIAQYKQLSFKVFGILNMIGACYKHLLNFRLNRKSGLTNISNIYGYLAVSKYFQPELFGSPCKYFAAFFPHSYLFGKENYTNAIAAKSGQMHTQLYTFGEKKLMRNLYHNTCAITGIVFTTTGAPMFHVFKKGKCVRYILVRFIAFNISHKPYTACIVLKFRPIQTVTNHRRGIINKKSKKQRIIKYYLIIWQART